MLIAVIVFLEHLLKIEYVIEFLDRILIAVLKELGGDQAEDDISDISRRVYPPVIEYLLRHRPELPRGNNPQSFQEFIA